MATLRNNITQQEYPLRMHHVIGRHPFWADTLLIGKDISQIHASICWNGRAWDILDHSRNGTLVNGIRLVTGKRYSLGPGNNIQFSVVKKDLWNVEEVAPLSGIQDALWNENSSVTESTLEIENLKLTALSDIIFMFQVSSDEEHTNVKLINAEHIIELGERVHHYLLITLARKRLKDAEDGFDLTSQGWIELSLLSKMIGLDQSHLNIQIFRARNQLVQALSDNSKPFAMIERRRGDVRLGSFRFKIFRGSIIEGELNPVLPACQ
jgi:hypothetical protein